jgi:transposase
MDITPVGVAVAKPVWQVPGIDTHGQVVVRKHLRRREVGEYFTNLPACETGREAWSRSHYGARRLHGLGHQVKFMAPQCVRPYVKTNKNDARDAEASCEAVSRPRRRFVPRKTVEQQAMRAVPRVRQGFGKARTAQAPQLRRLLAEFGRVVPHGRHVLLRAVPAIVSEDENGLGESVRNLFTRLLGQVKEGERHGTEVEQQSLHWHKGEDRSRQ